MGQESHLILESFVSICLICCRAGGKPEYYMGSADWMTRNLTRRVEVVTPVEDVSAKKELQVRLRF